MDTHFVSRLDFETRRRLALKGVVKLEDELIEKYPEKPRIVRIFTSSTFTDTAIERNELMARVFPKLKAFCSELGYEFQVVDMRWGIRDEATADHLTVEICMNELRKCQTLSTGPSFVTLLGQKYGYRPLPRVIAASEFEALLEAVDPTEKMLLNKWYLLDNNELLESVNVLQPITAVYAYYNDSNPINKELRALHRSHWWNDFQSMQKALRKAASCSLEPATSHKYFMSVTEDEIRHGVVNVGPSCRHSCLWFYRVFNNLTGRVSDRLAGNYIDKNWADGSVDTSAQTMLEDLKNNVIPSVLPEENKEVFELDWTGNGVEFSTNRQHAKYLEDFCSQFESRLMNMISTAIEDRNARQLFTGDDALLTEVVAHVNQCIFASQNFSGQEDVIAKVQNCIASCSFCILYGPPGIGRSAIAAHIAHCASEDWSDAKVDGAVVSRFIGVTPHSTSKQYLLQSLCFQLKEIYNNKELAIPERSRGLIKSFQQCLSLASRHRPLLVILDGLELLHSNNRGMVDRYEWLPTTLPSNVQLLVTTSGDIDAKAKTDSLCILKNVLPAASFVEVPHLSATEAKSILAVWLQSAGRTLTVSQQQIAAAAARNCPLPLYVKLLASECSKWPSYYPSQELKLPLSVEGLVVAFLEQLEVRHGQSLVSHALAIITAAKNGISECELEDILSCNDEVLDDVYQYWTPPMRRLPPMLWLRIQADLDDYLVKRGSQGACLLAWRHLPFYRVVRRRYLDTKSARVQAHSAISDYFLGQWAGGRQKPYINKDGVLQLFDRGLPLQPLVFHENSTSKKYNFRKLDELPYNLCLDGRLSLLKSEVLCCYDFLHTKLECYSLSALLDDFQLALTNYPDDRELTIMHETLLISGQCLDKRPSEFAGQIIGRLRTKVVNDGLPSLHALCCDILQSAKCCLMPTSSCLTPPGLQLRMVLSGHKREVKDVAVSSDNATGLSVADDKKLKHWDLETGACLLTIGNVGSGTPLFVAFTQNNMCALVASRKGVVEVWNLLSSRQLYYMSTLKKAERFSISTDQQLLAICSSKEVGLLKTSTGALIWKQIIEQIPCDLVIIGTAVVVGGSKGLLGLSNVDGKASVVQFHTAVNNVSCITACDTNDKLYVLFRESKNVYCYDANSGDFCKICFSGVKRAERVTAINDATLFALKNGQLVMLTQFGPSTVCSEHEYVTAFACNRCSQILIGLSSSLVCLFDLVNYHQESQPMSNDKMIPVEHIKSIEGDTIIGLGVDRSNHPRGDGKKISHLTVWADTGELLKHFLLNCRVKCFTALSQHHVLLLYHRRLVIVNLENGKVEHKIQGQTGRFLYEIGMDQYGHLVVLSKGRRNLKVVNVQKKKAIAVIKVVEKTEKRNRLNSVLVSADGNMAVCCQETWSEDPTSRQGDYGLIHVVNLITRQSVFVTQPEQGYNFSGSSVSPSGEQFALPMSGFIAHNTDKQAYGFQLYSLSEKANSHLLLNASAEPYKSNWCPSGDVVITSWWDFSIRLWCGKTANQLTVLKQHEDGVSKLIVSRNGQFLLSACESSADHQLCMWSMKDYSLVSSFTPDKPPEEVTMTGTGTTLFVAYTCASQGLVTLEFSNSFESNFVQLSKSSSQEIECQSIEVSSFSKGQFDSTDMDSDTDTDTGDYY